MASQPRYRMFTVGGRQKRFEFHSWSATKKDAQTIMMQSTAIYKRLVPIKKGYVLYVRRIK